MSIITLYHRHLTSNKFPLSSYLPSVQEIEIRAMAALGIHSFEDGDKNNLLSFAFFVIIFLVYRIVPIEDLH